MNKRTDTSIRVYLEENIKVAQAFPVNDVVKLFKMLTKTYADLGRVFIFGNGGGASAAEHFASDLSIHPFTSEDKHTALDKDRLEVYCINDSIGTITRVANDIGYDVIFREQLECHCLNAGDLVIAFSTSGNSPNVVKAIEFAKSQFAKTVLIGGRSGGKVKDMVDLCILVPGTSTFPGQTGANDNNFHIEDWQGSIAHMVTGLMREYVNGQERVS